MANIDRREFLTKVLIPSSSLLAGAGIATLKVENDPLYETSEDVLLKKINEINRNEPFRFGICPDFDNNLSISHSVDLTHFTENVSLPYYVGYFPKLEYLTKYSNYAKNFVNDMFSINEAGGIPYISINTDCWRFDEIPFEITTMWSQLLGQLPFEITTRLFIEANANFFIYGLNPQGFKTVFSDFSRKIRNERSGLKTKINLSFAAYIPGVENWPFEEYIPEDFNIFDEIHFDGYFRYPGLLRVTDLNYWRYGKITPEKVFKHSFEEAIALTSGQKPIGVSEAGSACADEDVTNTWLRHAALLTMSYKNATTFVHFGENKLNKKEYNWRPSKRLVETYGNLSYLQY